MDLTDVRTSFRYFKRLCIMYALLVKVYIFRRLHVLFTNSECFGEPK